MGTLLERELTRRWPLLLPGPLAAAAAWLATGNWQPVTAADKTGLSLIFAAWLVAVAAPLWPARPAEPDRRTAWGAMAAAWLIVFAWTAVFTAPPLLARFGRWAAYAPEWLLIAWRGEQAAATFFLPPLSYLCFAAWAAGLTPRWWRVPLGLALFGLVGVAGWQLLRLLTHTADLPWSVALFAPWLAAPATVLGGVLATGRRGAARSLLGFAAGLAAAVGLLVAAWALARAGHWPLGRATVLVVNRDATRAIVRLERLAPPGLLTGHEEGHQPEAGYLARQVVLLDLPARQVRPVPAATVSGQFTPAVALSPDGRFLADGSPTGQPWLVEVATGRRRVVETPPGLPAAGWQAPFAVAAWSPDSRHFILQRSRRRAQAALVAGIDGRLAWSSQGQRWLRAQWTPDGSLYVCRPGSITRWRPGGPLVAAPLPARLAEFGRRWEVALSPDGRYLLSLGGPATLVALAADSLQVRRTLALQARPGGGLPVLVSPHSVLLGRGRQLALFDLATGRRTPLRVPQGRFFASSFVSVGDRLLMQCMGLGYNGWWELWPRSRPLGKEAPPLPAAAGRALYSNGTRLLWSSRSARIEIDPDRPQTWPAIN